MKICVVTGASSGIGKTIVEKLTANNFAVWAGLRNLDQFKDFSHLKFVRPILLDVTNTQHIADLLTALQAEVSGELFGLVNNAGWALPGPWELLEMSDVEKQFAVNVFGPIALTQALLPMLRKNQGRVVNIGSISGRISSPFMGAYSASKFALEAFSDSLRREMKNFGVFVSQVDPGPIRTPIWDKGLAKGNSFKQKNQSPSFPVYEKILDKFQERVVELTKKAEPPELVAKVVLHALTSSCPKPRYFVGKGIATSAFLAKVLPDRILDTMVFQRFK